MQYGRECICQTHEECTSEGQYRLRGHFLPDEYTVYDEKGHLRGKDPGLDETRSEHITMDEVRSRSRRTDSDRDSDGLRDRNSHRRGARVRRDRRHGCAKDVRLRTCTATLQRQGMN